MKITVFRRHILAFALVLTVTLSSLSVSTAEQDGSVRRRLDDSNGPLHGDTIILWNDQALNAVRNLRLGAFDAVRLYAILNVAMFDALLPCFPNNSFDPIYVGAPNTPPPATSDARVASASQAAHTVLSLLYPDQSDDYDSQLNAILDILGENRRAVQAGLAWGEIVGAQIVDKRSNDDSAPREIQPAGELPGQFRGDFGSAAFRNMAPFVVGDPLVYVSGGPPALDSLEYAAAHEEVRLLGDARNENQEFEEIFSFWKAGGGSVRPPGEWIKAAQVLAIQEGTISNILRTSVLFTALSTGLADTSIAVASDKFTYQCWRPATAIKEADTDGNDGTEQDADWEPRNGSPGSSPEHTSGQSAFAAFGSSILAAFYRTDDIEFTLEGDNAIAGSRTFTSFSEAAAEAGRSRIFSGIHFEFSNQVGQQTGRDLANETISFWQGEL